MRRGSHARGALVEGTVTLCGLCAVYATFIRPAPLPPPPPPPLPPRVTFGWDAECGAGFVDDLWNGYARTLVRTQREHERRECVWVAREKAMREAEEEAAAELRAAALRRYPSGALPRSISPLAAAAAQEVESYWAIRPEPARLLQDLGLADVYPNRFPPSDEHWQTQVVARDMMRDAEALLAERQRARAAADTSACTLGPERREDVERAFDGAVWRLFGAGDRCARMYIGFGNEEVARLFRNVMHGP